MLSPYFEAEGICLYQGNCLDVMPEVARTIGQVDAIIADLPYGTTACKWDSVIPFEPLWECYRKLIKPNGAIVLFGSQPFTSALVMSNPKWFRYEWVWDKHRAGNFMNANRQPLQVHEHLLVFSANGHTYNPQKWQGEPYTIKRRGPGSQTGAYGKQNRTSTAVNDGSRAPVSILSYSTGCNTAKVHATQKPVALLEYLIRTYTNEGELVLDNTCGSGTTLVAAVRTGRRAIGIEKEPEYCEITVRRIGEALAEQRTVLLEAA
jgi:DNA modification methylase